MRKPGFLNKIGLSSAVGLACFIIGATCLGVACSLLAAGILPFEATFLAAISLLWFFFGERCFQIHEDGKEILTPCALKHYH